jgi:hypothetical protein
MDASQCLTTLAFFYLVLLFSGFESERKWGLGTRRKAAAEPALLYE